MTNRIGVAEVGGDRSLLLQVAARAFVLHRAIEPHAPHVMKKSTALGWVLSMSFPTLV